MSNTMGRILRSSLCSALVVWVMVAGTSFAGQLEDAASAYQKGDYATALRLYRPLAEQGGVGAQDLLGDMYAHGRGVPQNYAEAAHWYRMAAEQGDETNQDWMGFLYEEGRVVPQDLGEAVKWYRKAADQGWSTAQIRMGAMYEQGRGVPKDYTEATKWYRKAADQGNAKAQYSLGLAYANGEGVTQSFEQAVSWYRIAAEREYVEAQFSLGLAYGNGRGVSQDYGQAMAWYRKAADRGLPKAQFNLGGMYDLGLGVEKNPILAYTWVNLAVSRLPISAQNDGDMGISRDKWIKARDQLAITLTQSQIAASNEWARNWRPASTTKTSVAALPSPASSPKAQPVSPVSPVQLQSPPIIASPPDAQTESKSPEMSGKVNKGILGGETVAIFIGNIHYAAPIPNVEFAGRDAEAMAQAMKQVAGLDADHQVTLMDASKAQMEAVFGSATNFQGQLWRKITKSTNVVVYYSGHGAPRIKDGAPLLVPVDATVDSIDLVGYGLDQLIGNLSRTDARSITIYIDACFSGLSEAGALIADASPIQIVPSSQKVMDPRVAVFSASSPREIASWRRADGHGLFTSALLMGFSGSADPAKTGRMTLGSMESFVTRFVIEHAKQDSGREQHPQLVGDSARVVAVMAPGGWPKLAQPNAVAIELPTTQSPGGGGMTYPPLRPQIGQTPQQVYDFAFNLLRNANYDGATVAFQDFLSRYSQDPLAGNATYWLGQIPFSQGQYEQALPFFMDVYRKYPISAKAGESLLKVGLSYANMNKKNEACVIFLRFQREFPYTNDNLRRQVASEQQKLGC